MKEASVSNFGLLIAFVVPGFTALWGVSYLSETVGIWLHGTPTDAPTVSGYLYVTIGSIAAGVTISAVRWAIIDSLHHRTGIPAPHWDFLRLQNNVAAYSVLVGNHYQFFQFYSNQLVALTLWYLARRLSLGFWPTPLGPADFVFFCLAIVLFAGSRDALQKYYIRGSQLFGTATDHRSETPAVKRPPPPNADLVISRENAYSSATFQTASASTTRRSPWPGKRKPLGPDQPHSGLSKQP